MPCPNTLGSPVACAATSSVCMGLKSPDAPAYITRSVRVSVWDLTGASSPTSTSSSCSMAGLYLTRVSGSAGAAVHGQVGAGEVVDMPGGEVDDQLGGPVVVRAVAAAEVGRRDAERRESGVDAERADPVALVPGGDLGESGVGWWSLRSGAGVRTAAPSTGLTGDRDDPSPAPLHLVRQDEPGDVQQVDRRDEHVGDAESRPELSGGRGDRPAVAEVGDGELGDPSGGA